MESAADHVHNGNSVSTIRPLMGILGLDRVMIIYELADVIALGILSYALIGLP